MLILRHETYINYGYEEIYFSFGCSGVLCVSCFGQGCAPAVEYLP